MFVDLGVYGFSTIPAFARRDKTLRLFEKFTLDHGGYQALYAETLMSYKEFCQMFAEYRKQYEKVRKTIPFCEEAFPETYEKVSREGMHYWKINIYHTFCHSQNPTNGSVISETNSQLSRPRPRLGIQPITGSPTPSLRLRVRPFNLLRGIEPLNITKS